ncbi:hypothetical protein GGP51_003099 [Salinibacter ruber]|uniref:hypothetical protein n=1 Tax=Salinibacter ruber TaxID=146919 RepID=UPI0021693697|nr:hypothetical protein [Salinibacter ruber]MCS4191603.1 hypothetical protein [Salinibacter ruber]
MVRRPNVRAVVVRVLIIGLFIGSYVTVWRPVRDWASAHVMAPLLAEVDTPRARQYAVSGERARAIEIRPVAGMELVAGMAAPTGLLFVIGSVFLLALYPTRLYWVYLGLYQWLLGGLMLGALAVGVGWADWGFVLFDLLETDIYRGTSLGLPLLFAWLASQSDNTETESPPNS